jgi:hypothetical protein
MSGKPFGGVLFLTSRERMFYLTARLALIRDSARAQPLVAPGASVALHDFIALTCPLSCITIVL